MTRLANNGPDAMIVHPYSRAHGKAELMTGSARILDPTAPGENAPRHGRKALEGLGGKVIGFIDNSKPNFNHLVDDIATVLMKRYGVAAVIKHRKRAASNPAPESVLADLEEKCDLVITGSGD